MRMTLTPERLKLFLRAASAHHAASRDRVRLCRCLDVGALPSVKGRDAEHLADLLLQLVRQARRWPSIAPNGSSRMTALGSPIVATASTMESGFVRFASSPRVEGVLAVDDQPPHAAHHRVDDRPNLVVEELFPVEHLRERDAERGV